MSEYTCRPMIANLLYSGESIAVIGQTEVEVYYEEQRVKLPLLVVKGGRSKLVWTRLDDKDSSRLQSNQCSEMQNINHFVGELQLSV